MTKLIASLTVATWALSTSVSTMAAPPGLRSVRPTSGVAQAASYKRVYTFPNSSAYSPLGALTLAGDGNLYGLTSGGGPIGGGTMFRVSPGGTVRIVAGLRRNVGGVPTDGLTLGPDGLLYGTTRYSGTGGGFGGTIFKSTLTGAMTPLFVFNPNVDYDPGKVTFGQDGALYGILGLGPTYRGSAYKLTPSGPQSLTYFNDQQTGYIPNPLTLGPDGNLYGTAYTEDHHQKFSAGSAFRLTSAGRTTIALFTPNDPIREAPVNQLTVGPDGAFYGVTQFNTLYRLTTSGSRSLVADLTKALGAVCTPPANLADNTKLAVGSDGQLYGAAGPCVYRTTVSGAVTLLSVDPGSQAYLSMPAFGSDGNLYGDGYDSGSGVLGFVYEVTVK